MAYSSGRLVTVAQVPKMLFLPSMAEIGSPADPRVVGTKISFPTEARACESFTLSSARSRAPINWNARGRVFSAHASSRDARSSQRESLLLGQFATGSAQRMIIGERKRHLSRPKCWKATIQYPRSSTLRVRKQQ